ERDRIRDVLPRRCALGLDQCGTGVAEFLTREAFEHPGLGHRAGHRSSAEDHEGRSCRRVDRAQPGADSEAVEPVGPSSRVPVPEHDDDLIPVGRRSQRTESASARAQMGDLPEGRHGRETTCDEATENKTAPDATAANEAAPDATAANEAAPGGAAPNETAPDEAAG